MTSSLRIALISTMRGWQGGERQAVLLAGGLQQRGHELLVVAPQDEPLHARLADDGIPVAGYRGRGRSPSGLWQVGRILRRYRPEVVLFNDPHAITVGRLALLGGSAAAKIALRRAVFPIRSGGKYRRCDRVICVSRAVAEQCRRANIPDGLLRIVPDGVDADIAKSGSPENGRAALGLASHDVCVLCVASLNGAKGHRHLLEAWPEVIAALPDARLALAGDGELAGELKQLARDLNIDASVRFLGQRNDVPDLLAAAELFVMPSVSEGLCSSIIDAMFARIPVVATTAGGIPDLLEPAADGAAYGWLVPPAEPSALAAAMIEAVRSPNEARTRTERAADRAAQRFTVEAMVQGTLAVCREAIAEHMKVRAA